MKKLTNEEFKKKDSFIYEIQLDYNQEAKDNLEFLKDHYGVLKNSEMFALGLKVLKIAAQKEDEGFRLGLFNKTSFIPMEIK
jgi:hypothetical protein